MVGLQEEIKFHIIYFFPTRLASLRCRAGFLTIINSPNIRTQYRKVGPKIDLSHRPASLDGESGQSELRVRARWTHRPDRMDDGLSIWLERL